MVVRHHTGKHYLIDNVLVALPDLVTDDAVHIFIYGLKPWLKGFTKAQA